MIPFLMKRSKAVLFIAAILLLFGTYSAVNLPVKVFPSLTFPYIQVTASVENDRNISELEREVAFPIEDAVVGRGIVKEVSTTTTSKNVSVLVTLKDSATKDETEALVDELNQKLNNVSIELDEKQVLQFNSSDQQFMQIAIAPDSIENASVREELLDRVVPQLRQVSGVSAVDHSLDAYEMKYEFVIKPEKIENLEVSSQLVRHIRSLFDAQAMGVVEYAGNQVLVRTDREIVSETELAGYRLPNGDKLTDIVDVRLVPGCG